MSGKTLVVKWTTTHEWRVMISDHPGGVSEAIHQAMSQSGLSCGVPGVDAESVRFEVEE